MKEPSPGREWILLIHQLPAKPTALRVRTWRKLQKLGAIAIKNSVYLLPFNEKTHEDFQWLKQEIEAAGGDAAVFRGGSVEGATDDEIVAAFRRARDEEYAKLATELEGLTGGIREQKRGGHLSPGRFAAYEADLDRLHAELERVSATDFFNAKGRKAALAAYANCRNVLRVPQKRRETSAARTPAMTASADRSHYQGRRWVTRRNLHIDRLASAWLIRQFVDPGARFYFIAEGEKMEGGIPFDMFGAEFAHHGEDCTFETMLERFGLSGDAALRDLAEIVHDIDLKDDKFHRLEAAGLDATVRGLAALLHDDRKLLQQCRVIFDGLYSLLGGSKERGEPEGDRKENRRKSARRRNP